jgi:hypothetical protein
MKVPFKLHHITANTYAAELVGENKKYTINLISCINAVGGSPVNSQDLVGIFLINNPAPKPGECLFIYPGHKYNTIVGAKLDGHDDLSIEYLKSIVESIKEVLVESEDNKEWLKSPSNDLEFDMHMISNSLIHKWANVVHFYHYYISVNCSFIYKLVEEDIYFVVQ